MNEQFIREVDEEYRLQKLNELWQRYRVVLIGATVALIAGTGAQSLWKHHTRDVAETRSALLLQAADEVRDNKKEAARTALQAIAQHEKNTGAAALSALWEARLLYAGGEQEEAKKILAALAEDKQADETLRTVAALYTGTAAENENIPAGNFSPLINERRALKALAEGKKAEASALLQSIVNDAQAPVSLRARAAMVMAGLAPAAPAPDAKKGEK